MKCHVARRSAFCKLSSEGGPCPGGPSLKPGLVTGEVRFEQLNEKYTTITWRISGLTRGLHGFHIHERADFTEGCKSCGPHYNPHGKSHGGPYVGDCRHVGDLGNIRADENGNAEGVLVNAEVQLRGPYSVVGRGLVVHADPDDLGKGGHELSPTTGNAGARVACGEILEVPGGSRL